MADVVDPLLDELLDQVLQAWSEGRAVDAERLCDGHPERRALAEAALALAREVAVVRPVTLPTVPGYRLLRELGRGGMGVVYLARQEALDRMVALKVLPDAVLAAEGVRRRFLAEARSLGRIRHPHVVTVHEVVEAEGLCAFAMEWVDGRTLEQLLLELAPWSRRGPAPAVRLGPDTTLPGDPPSGDGGGGVGADDDLREWLADRKVLRPLSGSPLGPGPALAITLTKSADVRLDLFDLSGRRVRNLANRRLPSGLTVLPWDGRGDDGGKQPRGVYFARFVSGSRVVTARVLWLNR